MSEHFKETVHQPIVTFLDDVVVIFNKTSITIKLNT